MDKREQLYDAIAARKDTPEHLLPYSGGNGRVDRCLQLMAQGKLRTGGTLLDVGGSIGDLGYGSRDMFSKRIVVDISEIPLRAAASKGNETVKIDVDRDGLSGIEDGSVDLVTALDFIEHIIDPEKFAKECLRVLKPGGQVFLNTPNIQFWRHIEQLLVQGKFPHTSGDREVYHGGHLAFFTFLDLCEIFGTSGFVSFEQFKDEDHYESPPPTFVNLVRPRSQREYVDLAMRMGNSNLLFKASKP